MNPKCVSAAACSGCLYYRQLRYASGVWSLYACHYCYDTGKPRECPIIGCVRKRVVTPRQRKKLNSGKFNPDMGDRRQKAKNEGV